MDHLLVALLAIVCFTVYYYFRKKLNYFKDLGIPYTPGWPIFGNIAEPFFRIGHISAMVKKIYNDHPDAKYVGVFDFNQPVIMLRDPELIKNVTIKNFESFSDHKSFVDINLDPLVGGNLFNIAGDKWKEVRSLVSPTFTSSKLKAMYELMADCAKTFVANLENQPPEANKMVSTKEIFTKYANDVIASCAFGVKVDTMKDPKNDFYIAGKAATDSLVLKFFFARTFPFLVKLFKIKFVNDRVANFFKTVVGTTVKTRDETGFSRPDMVQLMMDARSKGSKYLKLDVTEMTGQALMFFFGGFDTTSSQLCIIAHELAINPDIQERLQDEIDEVLKDTNGNPTYDAISSMPYLDAVFNESLRRHSQASFLDRLCTKPFDLPPALPGGKPFTIEPGMIVWIPAVGIHQDPKYYENPEKFDPDRYYHKKVSINDVSNLGFGIGPRSCIGNRFAILETKIVLFFLLAKFNFKQNERTGNSFEYNKKSLTIVPEGGFWLTLQHRN